MEFPIILETIEEKIRFWMQYEQGLPQIPYRGNEIYFDEYRSRHDLDCRFLGGNLNADTIFSLWQPLKNTLVALHGEEKLAEDFISVKKRRNFLQRLLNAGLEHYLPEEELAVQLLSQLFVLGQGRENVMLLSNRGINSMRGGEPYQDYMPYFLLECFDTGKFSHFFNKDVSILRAWIMREELQIFFEDEFLVPESIIDLSGSGDLRNPTPPTGASREENLTALCNMHQNYINLLKQRGERLLANLL